MPKNIWPSFSNLEIQQVVKVLKSGKVNYMNGDQGKFFEEEFSKKIGNKYSLSVFNGTIALELAIKSFKFKTGSEILVTPRSFIASASTVISAGMIPKFLDIDLKSGNIDPKSIKKAISPKTKCLILVHLAGWPCDMDEILKITKKYGIKIIEDCSQAHGAKYKTKPVGSFGDISVWSFCQDKIISTGGEGGMISTNSKKYFDFANSYRNHGKNFHKLSRQTQNYSFKWVHDYEGSNYRLTEMQSVLGRMQLKNLEKNIAKRNKLFSITFDVLKSLNKPTGPLFIPDFKCQSCYGCKSNGCLNSYYGIYIYLNKKNIQPNWNTNKILLSLNKFYKNLFQSGACPEIYREKFFRRNKHSPLKRLSNAKKICDKSIFIKIHHKINEDHYFNLMKKVYIFIDSIAKK